MKKIFSSYYTPSEEEFRRLWAEATFVFDTNVLLNLYRYSKESRKNWIQVLKKLSSENRVFLPYHIGYEFNENRFRVFDEAKSFYEYFERLFQDISNKIESEFNGSKRISDSKNLLSKVKNCHKQILGLIKEESPDFLENDHISQELDLIFSKYIGEEVNTEDISQIKQRAKERYKEKIPPGYLDKDKENSNEYGDYFIWNEMLSFSREKKKSLIFVTEDVKEDWWLLNKSKQIVMPHPKLRKEFKKETAQDYYQYKSTGFIKYAKEHFSVRVEESTIKETDIVSNDQNEKRELEKTARLEALRRISLGSKLQSDKYSSMLEGMRTSNFELQNERLKSIVEQMNINQWNGLNTIKSLGILQNTLNPSLSNQNEILKSAFESVNINREILRQYFETYKTDEKEGED